MPVPWLCIMSIVSFQRQLGMYSGVYASRLPFQPKEDRLRRLSLYYTTAQWNLQYMLN